MRSDRTIAMVAYLTMGQNIMGLNAANASLNSPRVSRRRRPFRSTSNGGARIAAVRFDQALEKELR